MNKAGAYRQNAQAWNSTIWADPQPVLVLASGLLAIGALYFCVFPVGGLIFSGSLMENIALTTSDKTAFFACLAVLIAGVIAAPSLRAQTTDTTDPLEIAAECGGDANIGALIYASECASCHNLQSDGPPRTGPHLQDLRRRVAGSVAGYPYSPALMAANQAGLVWDQDTLHPFLSNPAAYLPGTTMAHGGMNDEQQIRDVMTYIRTASLAPPPERGTLVLGEDVLALEGDAEYGEYLSGECSGCHQDTADGQGIPAISGLPPATFIYAMHEFRARARSNPAMQMIASRLSDEEIAALAAYFASENGS